MDWLWRWGNWSSFKVKCKNSPNLIFKWNVWRQGDENWTTCHLNIGTFGWDGLTSYLGISKKRRFTYRCRRKEEKKWEKQWSITSNTRSESYQLLKAITHNRIFVFAKFVWLHSSSRDWVGGGLTSDSKWGGGGGGWKLFFSVTLYSFKKSVCVCVGGGGTKAPPAPPSPLLVIFYHLRFLV